MSPSTRALLALAGAAVAAVITRAGLPAVAGPAASSAVAAPPSPGASTGASSTGASTPSKKDLLLAAKAAARAQPARTAAITPAPRQRPASLVNLYNTWTHEWLAIDPATKAPVAALLRDHFLRCHYTNEATAMDPKLLPTVVAAAQHFHVDTVQIVSGFRHPKYNLMLRKKGHEVARDSQHTHGNAIDFYLPGIATKDLHAWALSQKLGGVGLYLHSGFVHMDTGRVRQWTGD